MTPSIKRRSDVIDEVRNAVCKDRCATHGDCEQNFSDIAHLWTWWLKARRGTHVCLDELDVAEMMNLMKSTRKASTPHHLDHWVDGAGYNVCGAGIVKAENDPKPQHHCKRCATDKMVCVVENEGDLCGECALDVFRSVTFAGDDASEPKPMGNCIGCGRLTPSPFSVCEECNKKAKVTCITRCDTTNGGPCQA